MQGELGTGTLRPCLTPAFEAQNLFITFTSCYSLALLCPFHR